MSDKRELLRHLKKVQSLTSAVSIKNQTSKKKSKKDGLKRKNKNLKVNNELNTQNLIYSQSSYQKDNDLDFFFSLFDLEKEFKKQMGKIKVQIYFIRWCHSYELKVLHRKHPKYYYNPNILSYVDQFPSTYQEPSIQLKDPPKISQLALPISSSESIADAVKRVSQAHRKSIREKEIQDEKEKKTQVQSEFYTAQEKQSLYQDHNTNIDETHNYDEELLRFTSQLLSNRIKSMKKRTDKGNKNDNKSSQVSKYSYQRRLNFNINNDDLSNSNLSSIESTSSKLDNSKFPKTKGQTKNQLKVSAPLELHTKRKKKSKPLIIDSTTNSISSSETNSKLKINAINSIDSSSETNSKKSQPFDEKKDAFFDFDPFSLKTPNQDNNNNNKSFSSESSQQNQKYKLMKIDQSIISIRPDKFQLVSLSDQDLSLPPVNQKTKNKLYQISNNDYDISVPPSQSQSISQPQSQTQSRLNSTSVSLPESLSTTKPKNIDTPIPNNILDQETPSSHTEVNFEIDHELKYSDQSQPNNKINIQDDQSNTTLSKPSRQNNAQTNKNIDHNLDEDSSDIDFNLSELKLPKTVKINRTNQSQNSIPKTMDQKESAINQISNTNQFTFLPDNSLFNNINSNFDNESNNKDSIKVSNNNSDIPSDFHSNTENNVEDSSKERESKQSDYKPSSTSLNQKSIFSKISDIINKDSIIEEEEEEQDQTEINKEESEILKFDSKYPKEKNKKRDYFDLDKEEDEEIQLYSQEENPSKIQISFDEEFEINAKKKIDKAPNFHSNDETDDDVKFEVNLRKDKKSTKKSNNFNLKDILPLSILDEIIHNSSNSENDDDNLNSDKLFTSDEEKIIQSYMFNDDEHDQKVVKKQYKDLGYQYNENDIYENSNHESENDSNSSTPQKNTNKKNHKSSPLSLSSGYDDESSSSESYIDRLKKIFPNLDLD